MFPVDYFLRAQPDASLTLPTYASLVNLCLIVALFIVAKKCHQNDKLLKWTAGINLSQQVLLYAWYALATPFYLADGLPLYFCRIVMLVLSLLILLDKQESEVGQYLTYLGIFGGLVALLVPNMDPYHFPHITNFSYAIGHLVMLLNCFTLFWRKMAELTLRAITVFTLVMTTPIFLVNQLLHTNYSYLIDLPDPIYHPLPVILVFTLVNLVTIVALFLIKIWQHYLLEKSRERKSSR